MSSTVEERPRRGRPPFLEGYVNVYDGIRVDPDVAAVFERELSAPGVTKADLLREALNAWADLMEGRTPDIVSSE